MSSRSKVGSVIGRTVSGTLSEALDSFLNQPDLEPHPSRSDRAPEIEILDSEKSVIIRHIYEPPPWYDGDALSCLP